MKTFRRFLSKDDSSSGPILLSGGHPAVWVVFDENENVVRVLKDKCAHLGAPVTPTQLGFMCHSHGWVYDQLGLGDSDSQGHLEAVEFSFADSVLELYFPDDFDILPEPTSSLTGAEELKFLSHASVLLKTPKVSMLIDPWLIGDTYWGSWAQFPNDSFNVHNLPIPTHVVITHPHPDHFHPQTLKNFDRDVPLYFPKFPSQIIPQTLTKMGFKNLFPTDWEVPVVLPDGISFAFLRPISLWEDSALLVRVKDWTWLNQNDAGSPLRDDVVPKKLDLVTSSFDVGASGYPLTWGVSDWRAQALLKSQASALVQTLRSTADKLRPRFFGPFASYWRLNSKPGLKFQDKIPHNKIADIEAAFDGSCTEVLRTIPGSTLKIKTMQIEYDKALFQKFETGRFDPSEVSEPKLRMSSSQISAGMKDWLEKLSTMSFVSSCEHIEFSVHIESHLQPLNQMFGIRGSSGPLRIEVRIPEWVAEVIQSGDPTATWHHFDIGYWCEWRRSPEVYAPGFIRLLRLGYVTNLAETSPPFGEDWANVPIASLIESGGPPMTALLSRAGLPCSGCKLSDAETLAQALIIHNPRKQDVEILKAAASIVRGNAEF